MKLLSKIIVIIVALYCFIDVKAISVDSNNITLEKGKSNTIDVYVNIDDTVTNIDFNLIYSTYDVVADFLVNPIFTDAPSGIRHSVSLGEHTDGRIKIGTINISVVENPTVTSGTVSITNAVSKNGNLETKKMNSQIINVNIDKKDTTEVIETTEGDKEIDYNLLKKINSKILDIKLKKDVFKYDVTINNEITELDLEPIAIDDSYKVKVSSQKIDELKDNKIIINVSNEKIEKEYEIKVNIEEKVEEEKNDEVKPNTFKYKGKWISSIFLLVGILLLGIYLNKNKK